jgi:hypothetical protein
VLHISRDDNRVEYELLEHDRTAATNYTAPQPWPEIADCADRIQRLLIFVRHRGGGLPQDVDELRAAGAALAAAAWPPELCRRLQDAPRVALRLQLDRAVLGAPWELSYFGDEFLCLRLATGRMISPAPSTCPDQPPTLTSLVVGLIANPQFDLLDAWREGQELRALFEGRSQIRCRVWANHLALAEFTRAMGQCDWLHFAGHAAGGADDAWRLADGNFDGAAALQLAGGVPKLVYASACESARCDPATGPGDDWLVGALLRQGVGHFVGTLAPILDGQCASLAASFYRRLLDGESVGEALQRGRQAARATGGTSLSWAMYVLYGDPAARIIEVLDADRSIPFMNSSFEFPTECAACGKTIATRHGVGAAVDRDGKAAALCRSCARTKDAPTAGGGAGAMRAARAAVGAVSAEYAELESRLAHNFLARTAAIAQRRHVSRDPRSGDTTELRLQPAAPYLMLATSSMGTRSAPPRTYSDQWYSVSGYRCPDKRVRRLLYHVTVVCPPGDEAGNVAAADLAMLKERLARLSDSARRAGDGSLLLAVLASASGWSSEAERYVAAGAADGHYDQQVKPALVNLSTQQCAWRREDFALTALSELLDFEDYDDKLRRVVQYVESLLPLEVSLSAEQVAEQMPAPPALIAAALRVVAGTHDLDFDDVRGVGPVLSEPDVGRAPANTKTRRST